MKVLTTFFALLVIPFISHAQDTLKKSIPLFKQSPKIDSLINSVINHNEGLRVSNKDSCFLLGLYKTKDDAGFISSVKASNHKQIISDFRSFWKNKNCGYFEFKGYLIFVYSDSFMKDFFSKSQSTKEFTFIKPTTQESALELKHSISWAVFYKNNEFRFGVH